MTSERDAIEAACEELADYFARLEDLAVEPASPEHGPAPGFQSRPAIIPEPYGAAGRVMMDIHEGIRRLEASLRVAVLGHPGRKRGGSEKNTAEAIEMVAKFAGQLDDRGYSRAAVYLDGWINAARSVRGINENRRWRKLRKHTKEGLPARCPYCRTFYLWADPEAGIVVCSVPGCEDGNGNAPVASVGTDETGHPILTWADGKTEVAPDLEAG